MTTAEAQQTAEDLRDAVEEEMAKEEEQKRSAADHMVGIALHEVDLFHDPNGDEYGSHIEGDARQLHRLHSKAFRNWLARRHYREYAKAPSAKAISDALVILAGEAQFAGDEEEVFVRTARVDDQIYLDLADERWRTVTICRDGWDVLNHSPVRFRRPSGMLPLPEPHSGKCELDDFRDLLNIANDEEWTLTVGWLLGTLMGRGPYPIKELVGERGSAKSTHARLSRTVVDPSTTMLRRPPREGRDLMISAANGLVVALDNLSSLSEWLADDLCRLASGGGFSTRALYTDDQEVLFSGSRPILLTGIGGVGEDRTDLPDRTIRVTKPRIEERLRRKERSIDGLRPHPSRTIGVTPGCRCSVSQRR